MTEVLSIGYGGLAPIHIWLWGGQVMLCLSYLWSNCYIHPYPGIC